MRRVSGNPIELSIENSQKVARFAHPKAPADTRSTGAWGQAASFKSSPAARSISSRLSLFGIDRACAVAATVTSHRVSIGRSSSTWWIALIGSTMRWPNRLARKASRSSWTRFSRAASIACMTGWADPSSYSLRTGATFFQPTIGGAFCVADADLGVLVGTPHDSVRADIVEQEEPEAERLVAGLGVPDEEPAGHRARAVAPARNVDAPVFVGQEHEHVAVAREQSRVLPGDGDAVAELTRHTPVPRDTVAKALDERIDDIRVPDPAIGGTGCGAQLAPGRDAEAIVLVAQRREYTDVLDLAGEAQIIVQRVRDDVGRHSALAEIRCRRRRRREAADLPKGLVRRCQHLTGERSSLDAEE